MTFLRKLAHYLRRGDHAAELREEMEFHRQSLQDEMERGGMSPSEAAAASRRAMGNVTLAREDSRDVWILAWLDRIWRDAVYGARALWREPTFSIAAILTLSLGIAATTTVFGVVDAELWKPLPFRDPQQLVIAYTIGAGNAGVDSASGPDLLAWRAARQFSDLAANGPSSRRGLLRDTADSILVVPVTANYFTLVGCDTIVGRVLGPSDTRGHTAVLTDRAWARLFQSDPTVIGRTVQVDDESIVITGVVATHDALGPDPDMYVAIDESAPAFVDRTNRALTIVGRMQPGVDRAAAQAELAAIFARTQRDYPDGRAGHAVRAEDLRSYSFGYNWRPLYFFLGAALLVLILTCVNVANLLLARALGRQREFAIRGALGGGRGALVRQLLIEGGLLAIPGAVAGLVITQWAIQLLTAALPPDFLERGTRIPVDARVCLFALAVTGLTTVAFGLVPALFAGRVNLNLTLGQAGRTTSSSRSQATARHALLVAEIALTFVLVTGAGLFVRSFVALKQIPLGFESNDRIALRVTLSGPRYAEDAQVRRYASELVDRVRAVPGIRDAVVDSSSPLGSGPIVRFMRADRPKPPEGEEPRAIFRFVGPDYFATLGIHVLQGRGFTPSDTEGAPRVAIVNESLARQMFDGEAIGRTLDLLPNRSPWNNRPGRVEIIGVVSNAKEVGLNEIEFKDIYLPFAQAPTPRIELIVRSAIPAATVVEPLRTAAATLDPRVPVTSVTTLDQRVHDAFRGDRFNIMLIGIFAALALLLAAVGVYGAMAYAVEERTREFGVRLALGALPRTIVLGALSRAARIGLTGGVLGAAAALIVSRLLGDALYNVDRVHEGMLYGVTTSDPAVLGCAFVGIIAIAVLAGLRPAWSVGRVDPVVALRDL